LPGPVSGSLLHTFGAPRADGQLKWQGIEIAAAEGATVTAVHRGRVAFADWLRGFGLLTIVDHGNGFMSLYAHADVLYKQVGDQVEGGEAIATAGKSGGQTEPGLYFEIRAKGAPVDPVPWLAKR
jgi:septal ring factor EnvC (AmiA/AmiB activator)